MHKLLTSTLVCGLLVAQQQQTTPPQTQPQQPAAPPQEDPRFVIGVQAIQVPVWVYDKNNNYVDGLNPEQFRIFDNNKEQKITGVDVAFAPISMVVCVQANADVEKMLPAV